MRRCRTLEFIRPADARPRTLRFDGRMTAIRLGTVGAVVLVTTLLLTIAHGDACWVAALLLALSTVVAAVLVGHARTGGRTD